MNRKVHAGFVSSGWGSSTLRKLRVSASSDWNIILCNGPRAEVERLREEARQFLWEELGLELSLEKSHITHVTEGFDFLGFHL